MSNRNSKAVHLSIKKQYIIQVPEQEVEVCQPYYWYNIKTFQLLQDSDCQGQLLLPRNYQINPKLQSVWVYTSKSSTTNFIFRAL